MDTQANTSLNYVLGALRAHEGELKQLGVLHAAVFGSVARGEDDPDSDVDILVTLDHEKVRTLFSYAGIAADIKEWIGREVDLAVRDRLKEHVKPNALRDAVDAF
ncbi:MAG: nucleotidyltransferase family protein [Rhodospirillales bacterium]|nr:nucleotidyltransferase family protein [Rhodospirillales bacterium]